MSDREGDGERAALENEFDTNLPTVHSYLGLMDNLQGYTLLDEGKELEMLGMYCDTWVCPGHTLPLYIEYSMEIDIFKQYMANTKTFVLICTKPEESSTGYGITMEIIEMSEGEGKLCLKAKGRQRCRILSKRSLMSYRLAKIVVKILPDIELTSPLFNAQIPSLNKKRKSVSDYSSLLKNTKYRQQDAAQLHWPIWVYNQYEPYILTNKIQTLLNTYSIGSCAPSDPIKLSYWFMQNFQLNNDERLELLKLNSAVQRLRLELHYLQLKRLLCCAVCSSVIANQNDVFAMSKDGVQSNYCNPGGHVYETLTVSEANRVTLIGVPSKDFSWFPGYAWTIIQCAECNNHIGWMFTSKTLKPKKFWALAKNCINAKIIHNHCQRLTDETYNDLYNY